jgi:hypothetical protein
MKQGVNEMATFEISRAGSNYPTISRNELPVLAIFKNRNSEGLRDGTFIHIGKFGSTGLPASISVANLTISTARDSTRDVAMVGQAQYSLKFFAESGQTQNNLRYLAAGDIVTVDGHANADGLPIAFGVMGRDDDGYSILVDFNIVGCIVKFSGSTTATMVGKFGLVGTEV